MKYSLKVGNWLIEANRKIWTEVKGNTTNILIAGEYGPDPWYVGDTDGGRVFFAAGACPYEFKLTYKE